MRALVEGVFRRQIIEMRRYGFDTVMQLSGFLLLFVLIFWGARGIGGADVREGDALPAIVIGFVVFWLVMGLYFTLATWMTQEATLGTLEQVAMSPFGLATVLVAEYLTSVGIQLLIVMVVLVICMALSGEWLHVDVVTLAPLVGLLVLQVLGISMAFGGFALVFKRVVSLMNLMQFAFLAMIALPPDQYPWVRVLPISLTNDLIRRSTVQGDFMTDLGAGDLVLSVVVTVVYLTAGLVLFQRMDRVARERGLVGVH